MLLRGTLLAEAQGWLAQRPADLSPGERYLIQASVVLKEREEQEKREKQPRELEQAQALAAEQQRRAEAEQLRAAEQGKRVETERRSRRRLSLLTVALLVAFVGAIGAAVSAWVQRNHAVKQTKIAFSRQLAVQAVNLLDSQLDLALLLSIEAVESYKAKPTLEATGALLKALQKSFGLRRYLHAHKDYVWSVVFSPDGKTLVSGSGDMTIRLWDVATGQPWGASLAGHQGRVHSVAFSPDGKTLASGSLDWTVRLWDLDVKSWIKQASFIANRNLTQEEWRRYMGDRPYSKTCQDLTRPQK